jgi:hypothetical protein
MVVSFELPLFIHWYKEMNDIAYVLPYDPTGVAAENKITNEKHVLQDGLYKLVVPRYRGFYKDGMVVRNATTGTEIASSEYECGELLATVTYTTGREAYGCVLFYDKTITGAISIDYQAVGGDEHYSPMLLNEAVQKAYTIGSVDWSKLEHPHTFTPKPGHIHRAHEFWGLSALVGVIDRVGQVVGLQDNAVENQILKSEVGEEIKTALWQSVNATQGTYESILTGGRAVRETMVSLNDVHVENTQDVQTLQMSASLLKERLGYQITKHGSRSYAIALRELLRQEWQTENSLMQLPMFLSGLVSWVDFSDMAAATSNTSGTVVKDKISERIFTSALACLGSNQAVGKQILTLDYGVELKTTTPIVIKPSFTVVYLTAKRPANAEQKFTLLSGVDGKVFVDTVNYTGLCVQKGANKELLASRDELGDQKQSLFACSVLQNTNKSFVSCTRLLSNYNQAQEVITTGVSAQSFDTIGKKTDEQNADLIEVMVFDRTLSEYEIDAVGEYMLIKHGVCFNLFANGDLQQGLSDVESDYVTQTLATTTGTIDRVKKTKTTQMVDFYYDASKYLTALLKKSVGSGVLAVNPSVDTGLCFLRKRLKGSANKLYRLKMDVYFESSAPTILLKVNGVAQQVAKKAIGTKACLGLEFCFKAPADELCLELFQTDAAVSGVAFAIDALSLTRDYAAVV